MGYLTPPGINTGVYIGITRSLCPSIYSSVCVSDHVRTISPELHNLFVFTKTWYGGALSRGSVSCRKIGSLSSKSRSREGLYNQNMTISTISSLLLVSLQANLV